MAIHCQVITSQVMTHRPDRDCPVIGRAMPHTTVAGRQWRRKVILTNLSVTGRYFGRVTGLSGRKPARAGHEPAGGDGRPGGGVAGGRPWSFRRRASTRQGDRPGRPAYCRRRGTAIESSWHINWLGRVFYRAGRPAGPDAIASHSRPSGNRWPARLCERFARLQAEVGRVARPGRGPGRRPGRPGRLGPASPAPAGFPRRAHRPARQAVRQARRLFSCLARPPAADGITKGYLPWPEQSSASIHLIT